MTSVKDGENFWKIKNRIFDDSFRKYLKTFLNTIFEILKWNYNRYLPKFYFYFIQSFETILKNKRGNKPLNFNPGKLHRKMLGKSTDRCHSKIFRTHFLISYVKDYIFIKFYNKLLCKLHYASHPFHRLQVITSL